MTLFGWGYGGPAHGAHLLSGHVGVAYVVFRPRWWQPWLWVTWWRLVRLGRAWGYVDVTVGARSYRVRVIAGPLP